jgi:hypothetical protein
MKTSPISSLLALFISLGCGAAQVDAAVIEFRKIVDTSTPIPGGTGNFTHFGFPVIDGQHIAFQGLGDNGQAGIYLSSSGALSTVVDRTSKIPGSSENYAEFGVPGLEGSDVAFGATGTASPLGVYARRGGTLETIASVGDPMPGGTKNFTSFLNREGDLTLGGQVLIDQSQVYFYGVGDGRRGYYRTTSAGLEPTVENGGAVPGRTLSGFEASPYFGPAFAVDDGQIGFWALFTDNPGKAGGSTEHQGIFLWKDGVLSSIIYDGQPKPGGGVFDDTAGSVALDGNDLAYANWNLSFVTLSLGSPYTVLASIDGNLEQIVAGLPAGGPPSDHTFASAIANGRVTFPTVKLVNDEVHSALKLYSDGAISQLIGTGDLLDGKTVLQAHYIDADPLNGSFGQAWIPPGMWENQVAFRAKFTDGSEGIYVATIPEPTTLALAALAVIGLVPVVRQRARARHARGAIRMAD